MKAIRLLFLIAVILATACDNMHPEIDIRLRTDYTGILQAIEDSGKSLAAKLALIEAASRTEVADDQSFMELILKAIDSMSGTLEGNLASIQDAIRDRGLALETKLALIQAAAAAGFADVASQQDMFRDALESLSGSVENKLALIETAVQSHTTSLEAKLGLIEAASNAGFADASKSQGLIAEALEAAAKTLEGKLAAIEEAINSQATPLAAKLALIETAAKEGFADSGKKQELLQAAVESLGGTMEQQLAAVEAAMQSSSSSLEAKIELLQSALQKGIGDQTTAVGNMKTALETSIGTHDANIAALVGQVMEQLEAISGKLSTEELAKVFKDIADSIDSKSQSDSGQLAAIQTVIQTISGLVKEKFLLSATLPAECAAVKEAWTAGDVILIFFAGVAAPKYLEMSYDGSSWTCREMDGDTESEGCLGLKSLGQGTMSAYYLPSGSNVGVSASGTDFVFGKEFPWYLVCTKAFTSNGGILMGELEMKVPDGYVLFSVPDGSADAGTKTELREPNLTPRPVASIAADGSVKHKSVARGAPLKGCFRDGEQKGFIFGGIPANEVRNVPADYRFTLVKGGWKGEYYRTSVSATLYTDAPGSRSLALASPTAWTPVTGFLPVDIGCDVEVSGEPVRVYWSNRNLGATSDDPANIDATYGDYYSWGETSPKDTFWWKNYEWSNADSTAVTKYSGSCTGWETGVNLLLPEDDASTAALGGTWHTPLTGDWAALGQETDFKWTGNSVGFVVTSKKDGYDGPEGPSLFIPNAGYYDHGGQKEVDGTRYWTANRYNDDKKAYYVSVENQFSANVWQNRCYGLPIRPVTY